MLGKDRLQSNNRSTKHWAQTKGPHLVLLLLGLRAVLAPQAGIWVLAHLFSIKHAIGADGLCSLGDGRSMALWPFALPKSYRIKSDRPNCMCYGSGGLSAPLCGRYGASI